MRFVESAIFSKYRKQYLDEESFRQLQNAIINRTTRIDREPGTGGLQKARWGADTKGKSGGYRVIFYYAGSLELYILLHIYPKSKQDKLTADEKKVLKRLVEQELKTLE